ncbi:hypothetical protein DL98DRAFT_638532 [Cadophora sp. DSE1049]|nr:hypothetical protein DL98DRAFT_638532 [Cadophora sp. DSE1049]
MHIRSLFSLARVASFALCAKATPGLAEVGGLSRRQDVCQNPGFIPCYPAGSVSLGSPDAYEDPLQYLNSMTMSGIGGLSAKMARRDSIAKRQEALCCNPAVECLVLTTYNIPFCYDQSSTAYEFSDGSGGIAATGDTFDAEGNTLNLYTGDYQLVNGTAGNYYKEQNVPLPNTSTLTIPQPISTAPPASSAATSTGATSSSVPETANDAVPTGAAAAAAFAVGIMFPHLLFM